MSKGHLTNVFLITANRSNSDQHNGINMKPQEIRYSLMVLSAAIIVVGYLTLWSLFPPILERLGGLNLVSLSVILLFFSVFLLLGLYIFRYAQGKPIKRWQLEVALTYIGLAILVGLAFAYDSLLPPNVPVPWRYFILPMATIVITFYLLRRISRIRKKLDEMSKDW